MVWRTAVLTAAALAVSGCAQERGTAVFGYQEARPVGDHEVRLASDYDAELEERQLRKKTLAAKVLAAIALERVTGRKPDPARFAELN